MNYLANLIGKKITDISHLIGEYFPLANANEMTPDVQNVPEVWIQIEEYSLTISKPIILDEKMFSIKEILGKEIINIVDSEEKVTIFTEGDIHFIVDLRDEVYVGPEAMSLHGPNDLIVVWN